MNGLNSIQTKISKSSSAVSVVHDNSDNGFNKIL